MLHTHEYSWHDTGLDRGLDDVEHHGRYIGADAVALDERNDGVVRNVQRIIGIDRNRLTLFRYVDMIVLH